MPITRVDLYDDGSTHRVWARINAGKAAGLWTTERNVGAISKAAPRGCWEIRRLGETIEAPGGAWVLPIEEGPLCRPDLHGSLDPGSHLESVLAGLVGWRVAGAVVRLFIDPPSEARRKAFLRAANLLHTPSKSRTSSTSSRSIAHISSDLGVPRSLRVTRS